MSKAAAARPAGDERADVLDALRGFALLGILISHVPDFTGYNYLTPARQALLDPLGLDPSVAGWLVILIRGKFLSLFALLFGIGFAVQLDSATRQGAAFRVRFGRRLAALFVIGAAHAAIWYGDILKDYAVLGLALLVAARWPARRLAVAAGVLWALRLVWPSLVYATASALGAAHGPAAPGEAFGEGVLGLSQGWGAFFAGNLGLVKLKALQMIYEGRFVAILAMFFVGAWVGKTRLYRELARHRRLLLWTFAIAAPLGVAAEAAQVPYEAATHAFPPTHDWVVVQTLSAVAAPALSLAYASAFALVWVAVDGRWLRGLAPVGRTALTSYVSQTLLCTLAFTALGLGGGLGAVGCLLAAVALFSVQVVLARVWLRYFRFGPLEWAWRCATYARNMAIRRSVPANGVAAEAA